MTSMRSSGRRDIAPTQIGWRCLPSCSPMSPRAESPDSPPHSGGAHRRDAPRALSALRFQSLIRTSDRAELITGLRRAMAIVRQTPVDVAALAADLYRWNDDVRTAWCFQYFGATAAAPERIPEETDA